MSKKQLITEGVKFRIGPGATEYWLERGQTREQVVYFVIKYKDSGDFTHIGQCKINNHSLRIYIQFGSITTSRCIHLNTINICK